MLCFSFYFGMQLKSLLADSERSKLLKKLSEANQYNRFLKRQVLLLYLFPKCSLNCIIYTVHNYQQIT